MIYAIPVGVDFTRSVVEGFNARYREPFELARLRCITNSARSAVILREEFSKHATVLPKIYEWQSFVGALGGVEPKIDARVSHVLEIANLLRALARGRSDIISDAAVYEVAYLLLELLEQSTERGLTPDDFVNYDASRFAEHWQLNASFFNVLSEYWHNSALAHEAARLDRQIDRFGDYLKAENASDPIFIIGSTGSRVAMRRLMRLVIDHANGSIILPAYDFDRPNNLTAEHPQFGFQDLEAALDLPRATPWVAETNSAAMFINTALAPAPATDAWLSHRNELAEQIKANPLPLTSIRAETQHDEVRALAALIHEKRREGKHVALVTPDRGLVRRLIPRLNALNVGFEDSAGLQMSQTPSGGFAGLVLDAFERLDAVSTVALLSHPFCAKLRDRKQHLRHLRWFEQAVLREYSGQKFWMQGVLRDKDAVHVEWLDHWRTEFEIQGDRPILAWVRWHLDVMARMTGVIGCEWSALGGAEKGDLALFEAMEGLLSTNAVSDAITMSDYARFWRSWLARERAISLARSGDDRVKILGQIEARTENADCVILASMNEGGWPSHEIPDMWLNRAIRKDLGMEIPERFVGLSAHDFLGAFAAPEVVLSRALSEDGAPTIESRFMTRLRILWQGVDSEGWAAVEERGQRFIKIGRDIDRPLAIEPPNLRPAVRVAVSDRPKRASVTALETLTKNGYKFYCQQILKLRDIAPLGADLDAAAMGRLVHAVMQEVHNSHLAGRLVTRSTYDNALETTLATAQLDDYNALNARTILNRFFDAFSEVDRAYVEWAETIDVEKEHVTERSIPGQDATIELFARVDRVDRAGSFWRVFDYKSGAAPYDAKNTFNYSRAVQLPITALILNDIFGGGLDEVGVIRYKSSGDPVVITPDAFEIDKFGEEFDAFLRYVFKHDFYYTAVGEGARFDGAYAHLARYGEWLESDEAKMIVVDDD